MGQAARKAMQAVVFTVGGAVGGAVAGPGLTSDAAVLAFRPRVTRPVALFFGDIFAYLGSRGDTAAPGPIVKEVLRDLREAAQVRTDDDPLVVVAHSMGGNIVYDILTHFDTQLEVDALITVGSQVALFKELRLYKEDQGDVPVPGHRPATLKQWINIYDAVDVLGFAIERVYPRDPQVLEDFAFDNEQTPFGAHTAYFAQTRLHERLRARLVEWQVIAP